VSWNTLDGSSPRVQSDRRPHRDRRHGWPNGLYERDGGGEQREGVACLLHWPLLTASAAAVGRCLTRRVGAAVGAGARLVVCAAGHAALGSSLPPATRAHAAGWHHQQEHGDEHAAQGSTHAHYDARTPPPCQTSRVAISTEAGPSAAVMAIPTVDTRAHRAVGVACGSRSRPRTRAFSTRPPPIEPPARVVDAAHRWRVSCRFQVQEERDRGRARLGVHVDAARICAPLGE
jgi:hypothetical protein